MSIITPKMKNHKQRRPQRYNPRTEPVFRMRDMATEPGWLRFHKLYLQENLGRYLYVRTDRLPRPVGGKTGAILMLDMTTGQLRSARYAGWQEWILFRDEMRLKPGSPETMTVEIRISELQRALQAGEGE